MANKQPAELAQPSVGAFDNPASFVTSQFPTVLIASHLIVLAVGRDQLDATALPSLSQRVGVVAAIRDHPFRLPSRPAFWSGDADFGERGVRKRNFSRRGTFQPNSQRNTLTVSQYHPLRTLAALGFTDCRAPFFAGAKLPSRKASSHFSRPCVQSAQQPSPTVEPNVLLFPLPQPSPTGGGRGILVRQESPRRPGLQHPQNAFKTRSVGRPGTAPVVPPAPGLGKQRRDQLPLLIGQQLLPLLHDRSSTGQQP